MFRPLVAAPVPSIVLGAALGAFLRLTYELACYRAWESLEDEVEAWRRSPRGRFNAWLDGLEESPE